MNIIFETKQGHQFTMNDTPQNAEKVLPGINFSRLHANTMTVKSLDGQTLEINTSDITSIKFEY